MMVSVRPDRVKQAVRRCARIRSPGSSAIARVDQIGDGSEKMTMAAARHTAPPSQQHGVDARAARPRAAQPG